MHHLWPDKSDAEKWGQWFLDEQLPRYANAAGAALAVAARKVMSGALDRGTLLRGRINRELIQLLTVYGQLQARSLAPRNEPN